MFSITLPNINTNENLDTDDMAKNLTSLIETLENIQNRLNNGEHIKDLEKADALAIQQLDFSNIQVALKSVPDGTVIVQLN